MFELDLTPELVVAIFAGALALFFDYFPKVAEWFNGLGEAQKKWVVTGSLFLIVAVAFAGDCYSLFVTYLTCDFQGVVEAVKLFAAAVAINQGVHALGKPTRRYHLARFGNL